MGDISFKLYHELITKIIVLQLLGNIRKLNVISVTSKYVQATEIQLPVAIKTPLALFKPPNTMSIVISIASNKNRYIQYTYKYVVNHKAQHTRKEWKWLLKYKFNVDPFIRRFPANVIMKITTSKWKSSVFDTLKLNIEQLNSSMK